MNSIQTIVAIEDDETIRSILRMTLARAGFEQVRMAERGDEGLELVRRVHPALVLLDLMLPGLDGLEICRRLRADPAFADVRILMLTARAEDEDMVRGLNLGADDYVCKPFSRSVLIARIQALLRRGEGSDASIAAAGLTLDENARTVRFDGRDISLTRSEFRILALLASHPGRVYSRARIIDAIRGEEKAVTERSVDFLLVGLRHKLGDWAVRHVETVRGEGYRVKP